MCVDGVTNSLHIMVLAMRYRLGHTFKQIVTSYCQ